MIKKEKYRSIPIFTLFLAVCYFPIFLHLDNLSLETFDEARLAVSALEMLESGNVMVTYFEGEPDLWSTKPPMMIWIQAGCMAILGPCELAVRLPSALAGLLTLLAVWFFCIKELKMPRLGYLVGGVLVTTQGFVGQHVTRTGDYDALLILWLTLSILFLFLYQNRNDSTFLYLAAGAIAFAVLTKGVAGLLFLPGMAIWVALMGASLRNKHIYLASLMCLSIIFSWYFFREMSAPGYLKAVWENELGGRYLQALENHSEPFIFYFHRIFHFEFVPWVYVLPLGIFAAYKANTHIRSFILLLTIVTVSYLLIISLSETKLYWYVAPVYPLLAILVGLGLDWIFGIMLENRKKPAKIVAGALLIIAFFGFPYKEMIEKVYHPKPEYPCNQYGKFLKKIPGHDDYYLATIGYNASANFYVRSLQHNKKQVRGTHPDLLKPGQKVVVCEENVWEVIREKYEFETLEKGEGCCALISVLPSLP